MSEAPQWIGTFLPEDYEGINALRAQQISVNSLMRN
jgi:hypothetical protein